MIERYSFGTITIAGKTYTSDVLIFADQVRPNWWRKEGHLLQMEDLEEVFAYHPEVLIIGVGAQQCMRISPAVIAAAHQAGIELLPFDTATACQRYNELAGTRRVVAALHLTC